MFAAIALAAALAMAQDVPSPAPVTETVRQEVGPWTIFQAAGASRRGDEAEANRLYLLAAEHGDQFAQVIVGEIYDTGRGVPQNYVEAVRWYRLAAEQGNMTAQNSLGYMYDTGQGVPQNGADRLTAPSRKPPYPA